MGELAPIRWQDFERFLKFIGCTFRRENSSHRAWSKSGLKRPIIVPKYDRIPVSVIKSNLSTLGISRAEYLEILKQL